MEDYSKQKQTIKQIQERIFPIICEIETFCKEKGIQYFLCSGTCLGAVRHGGFIPWDFDADIMFPRCEYERFVKEYHDNPNRQFEIGSLEVDAAWKQQFGRIWDRTSFFRHKNLNDNDIGACVDLFPIDGFPENAVLRWLFLKKMRILEFLGFCTSKTQYHDQEKFIIFKKVIHFMTEPIGWRYFSLRMNHLAKKYPFGSTKYAGVGIAPGYGKREVMERKIFEKETRLLFNGLMLPVPAEYDSYLTSLYDDYMKVPEGAVEASYKQVDDWEMIFQ